jgi:membrane dipeptidase
VELASKCDGSSGEVRVDFMVIDGHNDLPWAHREAFNCDLDRGDIALSQPNLHTDLPRLSAGGVKGQFWSVYVPSTMAEHKAVLATIEQIDFVRRMIARYDELVLATTADQVETAISEGRLASLLGIEGGHSIGSSLRILRQMHRLGVRYMTLTHNENTSWADSATDEPAVNGLSDFGRGVVAEMNRIGMMVDLSHVADKTMRDAFDASSAPIIFSHSNARSVCDVARNVPDDVLALVPGNGGLVMVTFVPYFVAEPVARWMNESLDLARIRNRDHDARLDRFEVVRDRARIYPPPRATLDDVVVHIEYLRDAIGAAHIGIGGDFDGNDQVTIGLEDVACYPRLFEALLARGWSTAEIDALAGRNLLRVMRDVEAVADPAVAARANGPTSDSRSNGKWRRRHD